MNYLQKSLKSLLDKRKMFEDESDEDSLSERKSRKKAEPRKKSGRAVKVISYHEDEISGDDIDKETYSDEETEQPDTNFKPGRRSTGRRAAASEAMRRNTGYDSDIASGEDADDDEFSSGDIEDSDSDFEEANAKGKRVKNSKSKGVAKPKKYEEDTDFDFDSNEDESDFDFDSEDEAYEYADYGVVGRGMKRKRTLDGRDFEPNKVQVMVKLPSTFTSLPYQDYSRIRWFASDDGSRFWNWVLVRKAMEDVKNNFFSIHIAAKELGVTSEMFHSKMYEDEIEDNKVNWSWKDSKIKDLLELVSSRKVSDANVAAQLGVSRKEIRRRCGGIKSLAEIEADEEMKRVEKINAKEEASRKKMMVTEVDKQIMIEEKHEENLSEYEKARLENLRERKAIMDMLGITQDKLEINKLSKVIKAPANKVVERREKSARIRRQEQTNRFKVSTSNGTFDRRHGDHSGRKTRYWFGSRFSKMEVGSRKEKELFMMEDVPKFDLQAPEILEITNDHKNARIFLDSITEECREMEVEADYREDVDWNQFDKVEELIVSTSAVTTLDSYGDLVSFGTAEGGVGVVLGGRSVSLRPHSAAVTGLEVSQGTSLVSCSWDGTVRRLDLVRQMAVLEHSAAEDAGVLGLVSRPDTPTSFILDCDHALVSLDTRRKRADKLVSLPITAKGVTPASLNIEPINGLVSVCRDNVVMIWDLRKTTSPVWSEGLVSRWAEVTFAGWSGTGAEFCVVQDGGHLVFGVPSGGVPNTQPRVSFFNQGSQAKNIWIGDTLTGKRIKHYRKAALSGDIWCRWSSILFNIKIGSQKEKSNQYNCTWLTATNSIRYILFCYSK